MKKTKVLISIIILLVGIIGCMLFVMRNQQMQIYNIASSRSVIIVEFDGAKRNLDKALENYNKCREEL